MFLPNLVLIVRLVRKLQIANSAPPSATEPPKPLVVIGLK